MPFELNRFLSINSHDKIFVIEQNRDAQLKNMLMIELGVNADKLISVLNYDGMPITANNIVGQISKNLSQVLQLSKEN
jgi:2-oxoglutarate ferredoxin oxidoreductase subunit alpha